MSVRGASDAAWRPWGESSSRSGVRVNNVCLESTPLFSMWLAVTDRRKPTRSLRVCRRIYDQVVSGLCPSLGNTTPVLLMEDILYPITSAGAQPVLLPTVQHKLAGSLIYVITCAWWYSVLYWEYYVYRVHPRLLLPLQTCHSVAKHAECDWAHRHSGGPG